MREHPTKLVLRSGLDLRRLIGLLFYAAAAGLLIAVCARPVLVVPSAKEAASAQSIRLLDADWSNLLRDAIGTLGVFAVLILAGYVSRRRVIRADQVESGRDLLVP